MTGKYIVLRIIIFNISTSQQSTYKNYLLSVSVDFSLTIVTSPLFW